MRHGPFHLGLETPPPPMHYSSSESTTYPSSLDVRSTMDVDGTTRLSCHRHQRSIRSATTSGGKGCEVREGVLGGSGVSYACLAPVVRTGPRTDGVVCWVAKQRPNSLVPMDAEDLRVSVEVAFMQHPLETERNGMGIDRDGRGNSISASGNSNTKETSARGSELQLALL